MARVFSDLTREGILRKERNVLVVDDVPALAEMVASVRGG
ncbi:MAG: hypothetical protein U5L06_05615 [Rhodovibrio sp.]|nr:hypothetical protein [Rhodovibrio sp.]